MRLKTLLTVSFVCAASFLRAETKAPLSIGSRVEMFVDNWLIESKRNVSLQLQTPVRREVVLVTDKPWEGKASAYYTVFQDGPKVRLYYRGYMRGENTPDQYTCYAESTDGIHFVRPNLGLYEFNGSKENNIVYKGLAAHNFSPFLDKNPAALPDEKYKAIGGFDAKLYAFSSADGIRWKQMRPEPVLTKSEFDSHNVAFWDETAKCYRCYSRYWTIKTYKGFRAVQSHTSTNFLDWTPPRHNQYRDAEGKEPAMEHFYTSATIPCPGAPHLYLAFPKRFLPERRKIAEMKKPGASDGVFMTSRDGEIWDRTFPEGWLRPGPDQYNWTHRNNMTAFGIVELEPGEFSLYASEHYTWPDNRLRRITVRRHGFASVHAGAAGGEFTTKPLTFTGKQLFLNYATSAAGSVQVEIQDENKKPLRGYKLAEMTTIFGDELHAPVAWQGGSDLSALIGKTVRFRFVMKDADIFALTTGEVSK